MRRLREEEGGATGPVGVTQASSVDGGKVDTFPVKHRCVDDVYNKLFELNDYEETEKLEEDRTQFAGNAGSLAKSFYEYANDEEFFSEEDRHMYKTFADAISERFSEEDSITIIKSSDRYYIVYRVTL